MSCLCIYICTYTYMYMYRFEVPLEYPGGPSAGCRVHRSSCKEGSGLQTSVWESSLHGGGEPTLTLGSGSMNVMSGDILLTWEELSNPSFPMQMGTLRKKSPQQWTIMRKKTLPATLLMTCVTVNRLAVHEWPATQRGLWMAWASSHGVFLCLWL